MKKPSEDILPILARVRYQARLTSSSITPSVNTVKQKNYKSVVRLPENEVVGTFVSGMVLLLQGIEFRWGHRGRIYCSFVCSSWRGARE